MAPTTKPSSAKIAPSTSTAPAPFLKSLASSRREIRQQALLSLRKYLTTRTDFTLTEYRKLWKGLYYCLYMQDKPRNQQALSAEIADLVQLLRSADAFVDFVRAFFVTIREQWAGLDRLRMDKFLYLIRRVVRSAFLWLRRVAEWEVGVVGRYLDVIEQESLEPADVRLPNGLRFHVAEVWIDELAVVDPEHELPAEIDITRPLVRLVHGSRDKFVRKRVQGVLDDERWCDWSRGTSAGLAKKAEAEAEANDDDDGNENDNDDGGEDEWSGIED